MKEYTCKYLLRSGAYCGGGLDIEPTQISDLLGVRLTALVIRHYTYSSQFLQMVIVFLLDWYGLL
jgi:hypothetical protein